MDISAHRLIANQYTPTGAGASGEAGLSSLTNPQSARPEDLESAARQFEALFTQMMLKSMRAASLGDDIMGGKQMEFYRDMYDQQIARSMTEGRGLGLAESMIAQLRQGQATAEWSSFKTGARDEFVEQLMPHAKAAAKELGVEPEALVAQAALETGFGKHMIRMPDGRPSYNLFNIKAHGGWEGQQVSKRTLEYENNSPTYEQARFRAYDSIESSFKDYVRFLNDNPRYAQALKASSSGEFLTGLQEAGYATDPQYAAKIQRLMKGDEFRSAAVNAARPDGGTAT